MAVSCSHGFLRLSSWLFWLCFTKHKTRFTKPRILGFRARFRKNGSVCEKTTMGARFWDPEREQGATPCDIEHLWWTLHIAMRIRLQSSNSFHCSDLFHCNLLNCNLLHYSLFHRSLCFNHHTKSWKLTSGKLTVGGKHHRNHTETENCENKMFFW